MAPIRFKPNVTVAAVIEDPLRPGWFLLVEEHTPEGLRLNNPAGHVEQAESPLQAVQREVLEETACPFKPRAFLGVYLARFQRQDPPEDVTYLRMAYSGEVGPAEPGRALDTGIVRTVWMHADAIRASSERHRSPLVWRCIEDHLLGRHFPLDVVTAHSSLQQPFDLRPR
jgi:8-oxo-dGTP pyrophosphatase MutT (NUDIX family)